MDTQRHHPIRIAIADDHPICRDGLRRLLQAESDLTVIGEACDVAEAVKLTLQLKPDILLLDLAMPQHLGPSITALLLAQQQIVAILAFTSFAKWTALVQFLP